MVGMPYLILGVIGTLVYRNYRAAFQKAQAEAACGGRPHFPGPSGLPEPRHPIAAD
jgi:hypothetical protein